jgi:putative Mg2+ transporter-C (MgtC) family protein
MPPLVQFALNVGAALGMGMVIGLERQVGQHQAGLRTQSLVCLGAALFVSLPTLIDKESSPTRVAGQVVSGIGFLGGGVILREGFNVRGMNTAATLWCSAAVGTLAGSGRLAEAAIGTVAVLAANLCLRPLVQHINKAFKSSVEIETLYRMRVVSDSQEAAVLRGIFLRHINSHPR